MDTKRHFVFFYFRARIFAVLLAGFFLIPAGHAQTTEQPVQNRYLFIFSTSANMKKRVPAVQKSLVNLFVTGMAGQLGPGDSIGVWTFDEDLRTEQFPLRDWQPSEAAAFTADIVSFVEKQRYSKTTRFEVLQPSLNNVVTNSDRLTVLIFCDGETAVTGTPYDDSINQIVQQRQAEQTKLQQPVIVVLRVQFGKYVGCTVNFPPALASLPDFPPLPPPEPATPPEPVSQTPPEFPAAPRPPVYSIIMIGTNSETKPAAKLEVSNPPPPTAQTDPLLDTNAVHVTEKISKAAPTSSTALPQENSGLGGDDAMALGASLLAVAGGLIVFMLRRSRKNTHSSLITRSMRKK